MKKFPATSHSAMNGQSAVAPNSLENTMTTIKSMGCGESAVASLLLGAFANHWSSARRSGMSERDLRAGFWSPLEAFETLLGMSYDDAVASLVWLRTVLHNQLVKTCPRRPIVGQVSLEKARDLLAVIRLLDRTTDVGLLVPEEILRGTRQRPFQACLPSRTGNVMRRCIEEFECVTAGNTEDYLDSWFAGTVPKDVFPKPPILSKKPAAKQKRSERIPHRIGEGAFRVEPGLASRKP